MATQSIEIPTYAYVNGDSGYTLCPGFPVPDYNVVPLSGWMARRDTTVMTGTTGSVTAGAIVVFTTSNNAVQGNSGWLTNISPAAIKTKTDA